MNVQTAPNVNLPYKRRVNAANQPLVAELHDEWVPSKVSFLSKIVTVTTKEALGLRDIGPNRKQRRATKRNLHRFLKRAKAHPAPKKRFTMVPGYQPRLPQKKTLFQKVASLFKGGRA